MLRIMFKFNNKGTEKKFEYPKALKSKLWRNIWAVFFYIYC